MCLNPKWIYKSGKYKNNNYNGLQGQTYEIGTYSKCGHCEICIAEKCNNWVIRNHYEERAHDRKCFITLTYKESPGIIVHKDFQDFMKRLRIKLDRTTGEKIRFMGADEYGDMKGRPHFHAIIYGWQDDKAEFLTINKKGQIVLQSKLIQECWGLGRTSYQDFGANEIPYIALYNTPQEEYSKAYKMTRKKLNELLKLSHSNTLPEGTRKNLQEELKELQQEFDEKKAKYLILRERNSWSQGLGWEEFEKEYYKHINYNFEEYIQDKIFVTPSPWVKRLANQGDYNAILEMRRREAMILQSATEEEERTKNLIKSMERRKKDIIEWQTKKTLIEYL